MSFLRYSIVVVLATWFSTVDAQQGGAGGAVKNAKAVKDTFALNLLTTIDKVLTIAADPSRPGMAIAGEMLRVNEEGLAFYRPVVEMPGAVRSVFQFVNTNRKENVATWKWSAVIIERPVSNDTMDMHRAKNRIADILKSFDKKVSERLQITVSDNLFINEKYRPDNSLQVSVIFLRPVHNTPAGVADSLIQLYKPLLMNVSTAKESTVRFAKAFDREDVRGLAQESYARIIREIADKDIKAAYLTLLHVPYFIKVVPLKELLSSSQQSQIEKLANQTIADYENLFRKDKPDPVVQQKKVVEKEQPPTDPCAREIWELKLKPGYYVSGNGMTGYIMEYSCATNLYTIAWLDAQKQKLIVSRSVSVSTVNNYSVSYEFPFIVCSHCKGAGHSMEYDWYQMGVGSNFYARSNDTRKITCGLCRGSGFIRVR